jgi:acyl CoA:acetate/3-ketoacid CoA transferase alpha subunit
MSARLVVDNRLALGNVSDGYTVQVGGFQGIPDAIAFIAVKGHGECFPSIPTTLH